MRYLIDSYVFLRMSEPHHEQQKLAQAAIRKLKLAAHELVIVPQVFYEYWVVVTRPIANNGLEMGSALASRAINNWIRLYTFEPDHPTIFELWWEIVTQFSVLGKKAHDARLAAAMRYHGCDGIVTFNAADFQRFAPLQVPTPEQVLLA